MSHPPALIIHGHFYQPPRENPWTGIVDREPSAAPAHDWNARICRECYRPNGWARIFDGHGAVSAIVNNYAHISYNFGPTLLSWLERHDVATYRRILEADRKSHKRHDGHGNAIAQGYNHAILPLCNDRDLRTQVRWGLSEFRRRYGRAAEALWLPETACDDRTLGVLIDEGLAYAVLAPGQAARVQIDGRWLDVSDGSVDPRRPYRYLHRDGSGRSIALFFYDGAISRAVAFEGALSSSQTLMARVESASGGVDTLVHAVTDGESYGHHFKFGDRCLAHALTEEAERRGFWVTNYGALLARHPPTALCEISLGDDGLGTSWSCAHGVGRWFRDCGCQTGGLPGFDQAWRKPLRDALDGLRDRASAVFEERMAAHAADPWAVRDAYIELVLWPQLDRRAFFEEHAGKRLDDDAQIEALRLCEMQRSAMLMYTSCGWFFNDLSGIETLQIMRYAGRLLDQLAELGDARAEDGFIEQLAEAHSNLPAQGNGADLYRREVLPVRVSAATLAAHISLAGLVVPQEPSGELAGHRYELRAHARDRRGRIAMSTSQIHMQHLATGVVSAFASCALHFGGVDLHCVQKRFDGSEAGYAAAIERIWKALGKGSLLTLLRIAEEELGPDDHGIEAVLPSARDAISRALSDALRERYAAQYEAMYRDAHLAILQFHEAGLPLPRELRSAAELALFHRFEKEFARAPRDSFARADYERAIDIAEEADRHGCALEPDTACRHLEALLGDLMRRTCAGASDEDHVHSPIDAALALLDTAAELKLTLDTERAQERLYDALMDERLALPRTPALERLAAALGLGASALEPRRVT